MTRLRMPLPAQLLLLCLVTVSAASAARHPASDTAPQDSGTTPPASGAAPAANPQGRQPAVSPTDDATNNALWSKAQRMYAANDFAQASAAANRITSPTLKKNAQAMLGQIQAYVAALQEGVAAESRHDPVAAIKAYASASRIKNDGPGDPSARIVRVQQQAAAGELNKEQQEKEKQVERAMQRRARAVQLAKKGTGQEASGDLQAALASFTAAQAFDPTNVVASAGVARLQARGNSPTPVSTLSPAPAIRAFYAGQYGAAEQQLNTFVSSPGTKFQGAAWFYLGASRYYRALLDDRATPANAAQRPGVLTAFHQAHVLGYIPLPQFVAPALMALWKQSS